MSSRGVTESLGKLKISEKAKTKKAEPVDSWEDAADDSSETETEDAGTSTPQRPSTSDVPNAPPPTPSSPKSPRERIAYQSFSPLQFDGAFENTSLDYGSSRPGVGTAGEEKRPEKTTAVASRLIAAGLGQRAPKRTKEQREYDQAMKIQEKKKRDAAKEAEDRKKREAEAAKKAIWDD